MLLLAELGLECDAAVYTRNRLFKLPGQSKFGDDRVQAILDGSPIEEHFVTQKIPARHISKAFMRVLALLPREHRPAPDNNTINPFTGNFAIPADWTLAGDPLETLKLLRHDRAAHRLSRTQIFTVMSWCAGRGVGFSSFYKWAMLGRDDTTERHQRYADNWKQIEKAKATADKTIFTMIQRLYPDVVIEAKETRKLIEFLAVKPTTVMRGREGMVERGKGREHVKGGRMKRVAEEGKGEVGGWGDLEGS
ncbi:hypothetical protein [Limnohabitans sp.]|uniref:hypothetical protein n=1 Tax=Limnohabitans sp. TaxID=1907725 RepID=UPI002AFE77EA|nr:hypothetical protein [Limnohabitans sp.]